MIATGDPLCRGVVLLGLEAPIKRLEESFAAAHSAERVRGFAVGRTIFAEAADRWLKGEIGDEEAIDDMARKFGALVDLWLSFDRRRRIARSGAAETGVARRVVVGAVLK